METDPEDLDTEPDIPRLLRRRRWVARARAFGAVLGLGWVLKVLIDGL
jgi:hypothetical protein